jgi:EmrB/QacA subfamily drug resistance transporter
MTPLERPLPDPAPPPLDPVTVRVLPWLVAVALFMQMLDGTILNTALPSMAVDLGESPLRMHSVVVAYLLTVALLIPASGWLADRFGTRRTFIAAISLFSLGSLLCALSPSLPLLVAARVVQGIGGALLPVGRLAILRTYPRVELLRVLTLITLPGLVGPLLGPTLGGWLVEVASWHWIFLVNLPVGLVGIFVARRYMPDLRAAVGGFQWGGFLLFSIGLVLASLALQGLGERAMSAATSLLMLVAGLAAMVGYWLHAARVPTPLFPPSLFRIPSFAIGIAGNLFTRLGSGAMPFLIPVFLQVALGYSPASAGMSMIPTALGAMASKSFAVRLIGRLGYRRVLLGNTLLLGLVIASFALVSAATPHPLILLMLGVFGVINSLQFSAMNALTLRDLDAAHASSGNSLHAVSMQLAMSLGVATGGLLVGLFTAGGDSVLRGFQLAFLCVGALSALAACVFFQLGGDTAQAEARSWRTPDGHD